MVDEMKEELGLAPEAVLDGDEVLVTDEDEGKIPSAAPGWTEMAEKRGLDPLGMQSLCISLYQSLVPGISNVTLRVRYYGLYAWLSWRYSEDVRSTARHDWRRYIRRAEALCALVSRRANQFEPGISGSVWARNLLNLDQAFYQFHLATDQDSSEKQYLRQDMGAFGAAYGSQVGAIGLLGKAESHDIPVPTEAGLQLATVFADIVGPIGDKFLQIAERGMVTSAELDELAPMSLGNVSGLERETYENLLMDVPPRGTEAARRRRRTLEMVLRITGQLGRELNAREIRWAAYSGRTLSGKTLDLPGAELEEQRFAWSVYHANDLLHMAYECLLKFTLHRLADVPSGLRPERLMELVASEILASWDEAPQTWQELEAHTPLASDAWSQTEASSEYLLTSEVLDAEGATSKCTIGSAKAAVVLLAVLSKRFTPLTVKYVAVLGPSAKHDYVQSLLSELTFLALHSNLPLSALLQKLVLKRILERHLWVAFQKLHYQRDYTFLVESQDGILRTRKIDGPTLTNPRLESTVDFLRDVGLVDAGGLTAAGHALMERL